MQYTVGFTLDAFCFVCIVIEWFEYIMTITLDPISHSYVLSKYLK
jgi:hypothetical protein